MPYYQFQIDSKVTGKALYKSATYEAESLEEAIDLRNSFLNDYPGFLDKDTEILWCKISEASTQRGGKRNGAGRPKGTTKTEKTKVVRIPESIDVECLIHLREDLLSLIDAWEKELHPTSPRHEKGREIITEIKERVMR
jgi:hypothetical protein